MSKYKVKNSIWFILAEGIKIYFSNIDKFFTYMLFPVFGQIIGIALAFGLSVGLSDIVSARVDSISKAMLIILLLAVPGLLIFMKAFWDYMVAYIALNSMTEGAITTGKVYDFQSHNQVATRRSFKFVLFLFTVGIFSLLATNILLLVPGFILWIYFILVFQVFTFEEELTAKECFKRSFSLIKGDWFRTFLLMAILSFFSIFIISQGITVIFDYLDLTKPACSVFNVITNTIPLDALNKELVHFGIAIITPDMISEMIFENIITMIVMGLTLPIRSICWTIWYYNLSELKTPPAKPTRSRRTKTQEE